MTKLLARPGGTAQLETSKEVRIRIAAVSRLSMLCVFYITYRELQAVVTYTCYTNRMVEGPCIATVSKWIYTNARYSA